MKRLFLLAMFGTLLFVACIKDEKDPEQEQKPGQEQLEDNNKFGCVTGKITIFNTGQVSDAYVRLSLSEKAEAIYSKLIASDGDYTIDDVKEGAYFFRVYKQGFVDTLFKETISIQHKALTGNKCRQMDWAISKLPPNLYIVEVNSETRINTLNFGDSENRLYFQIYNNSTNTYSWFTDFDDVKLSKKWFGSMNPISGTLSPNKAEIITITIDRNKLNTGQNSARFLIDSNNGGGGVLTIIAFAL